MSLDPVERESLAEELLLSVTPSEREAIDAAWMLEIRQRDAAHQRGDISASGINEVIDRITSRTRK